MNAVRQTYAVWELTLQCNLACVHCGSRADKARPEELTTAEALDLVQQMRQAGIAEVTLIGGEAYLRPDWLEICRAIRDAGISCTVTTGGYGISAATAAAMQQAGIQQVSVSIDGLRQTHDQLRGRTGSWDAAFRTLGHLRAQGIRASANTQINRLSAPELPRIYADLLAAGVEAWQLGFTVPMGRAADRPELLLQPSELLEVFPILNALAEQAERDNILFYPGNNVGYYGPYERRLRKMQGENAIWDGCQAGLTSIGIEADGTIKGCPSLPTPPYTGGNIRQHPLSELLATPEVNLNANAGTPAAVAPLWGFCATCDYAELCRGGCTWTAHVFFGRRGNNPYCHHRALTQAAQGIRERLVLEERAPGDPFDHGRFRLIEESTKAPWPANDPLRLAAPNTRPQPTFPILN